MTVPDDFLEDVARRFALLGDPTRLRVVRVMHECGECTVGEIAEAAGTSVANASQHLQRLTAGGVAGRRRDGQAIRYRIVDDTIEQLCSIVCDSVATGADPSAAVAATSGAVAATSGAVAATSGAVAATSGAGPARSGRA